jgi:amidohydrolase
VDAIAAGAAIVQALQQIVSRRIDPLEPVVVTVGRFHAGTAKNVIADRAVIEGTLRVLDEGVRGDVVRMIGEVVTSVAAAHGATAILDTADGEPVLKNDPALTALVRAAAVHVVGPDRVREVARPSMGSEDFAFYVRAAPVTMFRLGVRNEAETMTHPLHHPEFAIDETAIPVGAAVMLESARRFLDGGV